MTTLRRRSEISAWTRSLVDDEAGDVPGWVLVSKLQLEACKE